MMTSAQQYALAALLALLALAAAFHEESGLFGLFAGDDEPEPAEQADEPVQADPLRLDFLERKPGDYFAEPFKDCVGDGKLELVDEVAARLDAEERLTWEQEFLIAHYCDTCPHVYVCLLDDVKAQKSQDCARERDAQRACAERKGWQKCRGEQQVYDACERGSKSARNRPRFLYWRLSQRAVDICRATGMWRDHLGRDRGFPDCDKVRAKEDDLGH